MNLSRYQEHYSLSHRLKRYGWYVINRTLFRMMATNAMKVPRNLLLRLFGATDQTLPHAVPYAIVILGGLGTAAFAQPYTMSTALERTFHIPAWVVTVTAAAICGIVLIGGVKGIGLVGAVVALMDAGYQVRRISGTSAGSLVGAVVAAGAGLLIARRRD